jgi:hypothetical protein
MKYRLFLLNGETIDIEADATDATDTHQVFYVNREEVASYPREVVSGFIVVDEQKGNAE